MSNLSEPMVFEVNDPIEVPVKIGNKDYLLKQVNAGGVVIYKNQAAAGMILDSSGNLKGLKVGELDPLAVHLSLYYNDLSFGKLNGSRVPLSEVNAFDPKIVAKLAERARLISNMEEESGDTIEILEKKLQQAREKEELLKNESGPSTDQSE